MATRKKTADAADKSQSEAVVRLWRENRTIAEIAAETGLDVWAVNRLVILTGEAGRSIYAGFERIAAARHYTIAPLRWKRDVIGRGVVFYVARTAWASFDVYPVGYLRSYYDGGGGGGEPPARPRWKVDYNTYGDVPTGGECRTVAECKAAANAHHRDRVAELLTPAPRSDLAAILRRHHEWQLGQMECGPDMLTSIAEAYAESELCEATVAALAGARP